MLRNKMLSACTLCLAVLASSPALAQMRATASFSQIEFTLGDLRPQDAFDPWMETLSVQGSLAGLYSPGASYTNPGRVTASFSGAEQVAKVARYTFSGNQVEAKTTAVPGQVQAQTVAKSGQFNEAWDFMRSSGSVAMRVYLGAFTSVTVSLTAYTGIDVIGTEPSWLTGTATASVDAYTASWLTPKSSTLSMPGGHETALDDWTVFTFVLSNNTAVGAEHLFGFNADALVTTTLAPPVPEPAPVAMFTLGLAGLMLAARHRTRRR